METSEREFFKYDDYFIDEKVAFLKFTNTYRIYNSAGERIGAIKETMPAVLKVLSLILSKAFFPFRLDIVDLEGRTLAAIKRGWTFLMSNITVLDSQGKITARIKQRFRVFKPAFSILDPDNNFIAAITGDWIAWHFDITAPADNNGGGVVPIGTITKKWNGVLKETFTTADKYIVSLNRGAVKEDRKIAVVAAAITIDMVLKESK
ncbi:MAG: hypothetical protein LBG84_10360 [Treponema sp.]|jgi:uncharacterized protein YxjI|nr:hypothetical protein [Treponema sp.]